MPLNKPGRSGGILPYLFLYIPVVWAALLIAQSLGNGLPELLTNLTAALQTPLKIRWTEHSLMSILACTGAYIIGICLYCTIILSHPASKDTKTALPNGRAVFLLLRAGT